MGLNKRLEDDMGCAGIAFTDPRGLAGASFPRVMGLENQQLFPNQQ